MSRSYLFVPGDVPRMLQNLDVFDADSVIIDFEDSVNIHEKDEARRLTHAFLSAHPNVKPDIYIRINGIETASLFEADLNSIKTLPLAGIVLPKVNQDALDYLSEFYKQNDMHFKVIGIVETPDVFFDLLPIAKHPLIKGLLLGGEDLTKNLDIERTTQGDELLFARSQLIFACKSSDKEVIDTPFTDVLDSEGLEADTTRAAQLGFTAKSSIHPNHVEIINTLFSPSKKRITEAMRIIKQHEKLNRLRFSLDGKMVDKPVIERAQKLIERAKKYGVIR